MKQNRVYSDFTLIVHFHYILTRFFYEYLFSWVKTVEIFIEIKRWDSKIITEQNLNFSKLKKKEDIFFEGNYNTNIFQLCDYYMVPVNGLIIKVHPTES